VLQKQEHARRYETMIVLRADLQETGVKEQVDRVCKLLEANGAAVAGVHEWGLRTLAYPIRKERRGYYCLAEYAGPAAAVSELERQLKLSDVVLRFVSVRQEEGSPSSLPPREEEASAAFAAPEPDAAVPEGVGDDAETADVEP
jgi:small subunit ribosomal protein S6